MTAATLTRPMRSIWSGPGAGTTSTGRRRARSSPGGRIPCVGGEPCTSGSRQTLDRPLIKLLLVHGGYGLDYDYFVWSASSPGIWREVEEPRSADHLAVFLSDSAQLVSRTRPDRQQLPRCPPVLSPADQARPLNRVTARDLDDSPNACAEREANGHRQGLATTTRRRSATRRRVRSTADPVFNPTRPYGRDSSRPTGCRAVTPPIRTEWSPTSNATRHVRREDCLLPGPRLKHFGAFLARPRTTAPTIRSPIWQRCRQIEKYLSAQVEAINTKGTRVISVAERCRGSSRWGVPHRP